MKLQALSSSSRGNCYVLQNDSEALIIEAGVQYLDIKRAVDFNLDKVAGCVVSHRHKDHSKSVKNLLSDGIKVFALEDVFESISTMSVFAYAITPGRGFRVKGFRVFPFAVKHDVPCLGFLITHNDCGTILFITDTIGTNLSFSDINHVMIEANYSDATMKYAGRMCDRVILSHMNIETTKAVIAQQETRQLRNIILMHLSDSNSDEKAFLADIAGTFGVPAYAANTGLILDLTTQGI